MIFPTPPLRLKSSFVWKHQLGGIALLLAGLAAGGGYAWWQYSTVQQLLNDSRIWAAGVVAPRNSVQGEVTTNKFIFRGYKLDVSYVDAGGATHQHKLEFDTLGGEVDQSRDTEVRYLESDPDQFALSWAVEVKISRWASVVFMAVAGVGLIGGSFVTLGWIALRRLTDARHCARRSDEIMVRITKVTQQVVQGKHNANVFHYTGQTIDGRVVSGKQSFTVKFAPLFGDPARQTLVALVAPENIKRPVIVRSDFHPYALTADEEVAARAAIARNVVPVAPPAP